MQQGTQDETTTVVEKGGQKEVLSVKGGDGDNVTVFVQTERMYSKELDESAWHQEWINDARINSCLYLVYLYLCTCICIHLHMSIYMYIYIYIYMCVRRRICICVHIFVYVGVCVVVSNLSILYTCACCRQSGDYSGLLYTGRGCVYPERHPHANYCPYVKSE